MPRGGGTPRPAPRPTTLVGSPITRFVRGGALRGRLLPSAPAATVVGRQRSGTGSREGGSAEEALASRRRRAAEEPLDVRLAAREPVVRLEVRNPVHRTSYAVVFPEYPLRGSALCTCTDFARRGLGSCKHIEAGWSWLEEHGLPAGPDPDSTPPTGAGELWTAIDRRLDALRRERPQRMRDVERVGALLFEPPAARAEGPEKGTKEGVGGGGRRRRSPTRTSPGPP